MALRWGPVAWTVTGLVGIFIMAVASFRPRAVLAGLDASFRRAPAELPADVPASVRGVLAWSLWLRASIAIVILVLMNTKPGWVGSSAILAEAVIFGLAGVSGRGAVEHLPLAAFVAMRHRSGAERSSVGRHALPRECWRRDEAERVTCWISEYARARRRLVIELRGAQIEHGTLGRIEILYSEMQVRLHGRRGVRPRRWPMPRRPLERQMEPRLLALANRVPIRVGVDHWPSGELAVEVREPGRISAFEGDPA